MRQEGFDEESDEVVEMNNSFVAGIVTFNGSCLVIERSDENSGEFYFNFMGYSFIVLDELLQFFSKNESNFIIVFLYINLIQYLLKLSVRKKVVDEICWLFYCFDDI